MAYLQSTEGEPLPADLIVLLAEALGLTIPAEDVPQLATALRDQFAAVHRIETLNLDGIGHPRPFDPRWHD